MQLASTNDDTRGLFCPIGLLVSIYSGMKIREKAKAKNNDTARLTGVAIVMMQPARTVTLPRGFN